MTQRKASLGWFFIAIAAWQFSGCGPAETGAHSENTNGQSSTASVNDYDDDDTGLPAVPKLTSAGLEVGPYDLLDIEGKPFDETSLDGEVYVVDFFFTACPVQCPKLSQAFEHLQDKLGDKGLRLVSVSVDPTNDTPEVLQQYAKKYHAKPEQWTFLTGEREEIDRVAHEVFRVPLQDRLHTEKFILVDRQGEIVDFYNGLEPESIRQLEQRATELLKEPRDEAQS